MLIGGDDISNDVITLGMCFQCLFTFALVSASRWLGEIWQLSRRGATEELEVEFKFQRRSCSSPSISLQLVENLATPLMASTPGFEPGPWHYWEASALTTAPLLLLTHLRVFLSLHFSVILRPWVLVRSWGVEPTTFRSAVKRSTDWECPARLKNRNVCCFSLWSVKRTPFLQLCALRCVCWQDGR